MPPSAASRAAAPSAALSASSALEVAIWSRSFVCSSWVRSAFASACDAARERETWKDHSAQGPFRSTASTSRVFRHTCESARTSTAAEAMAWARSFSKSVSCFFAPSETIEFACDATHDDVMHDATYDVEREILRAR